MPAFPHLSATDLDNLVTFLATPVGGRGRGAGAFAGRGGRGALPSGAPPELIAGSGSVWTRPEAPGGRGRGAAIPYPDGTPNFTRYTINEYNTVGNRIKPPFTTIVKYDLNQPAIKWRIGFGDDPVLAARGITGTGAPAVNNGLILTESGLLFGAGLDNHIRAWDTRHGQATLVGEIRRHVHRLAGDVRDGRAHSTCSSPRQARWFRRRTARQAHRRQPPWAGSPTRYRLDNGQTFYAIRMYATRLPAACIRTR